MSGRQMWLRFHHKAWPGAQPPGMLVGAGETGDELDTDHSARLMIGNSRRMLDVFAHLRRFAACDMPVLITGESGTGKELAARAIHERSGRKFGPYVAFNCGAVPEAAVAEELFGRSIQSPGGNGARRRGHIERADCGTLFLDEFDELPAAFHAPLLQLLQHGEIAAASGGAPVAVDVRLVAARRPGAPNGLAAGEPREELYGRLNVLRLHLPPLRERGADVELLGMFFLRRIGQELGRELAGFAPSALAAMLAHSWPGNVRELIAVVRRAAVLAQGPLVGAADLQLDPPRAPRAARKPRARPTARPRPGSPAEREAVLAALRDSGFNMTRAAQLLGVARATLYRMLERNRIEVGQHYRVQPLDPEREAG